MLEQLENGETVEAEENVYTEETITHYRIAILILSVVSAISVFGIVFLILRLLKS